MAVIAVLFLPPLLQHKVVKDLPYKTFLSDVSAKQIQSAQINNATGVITGNFKSSVNGAVELHRQRAGPRRRRPTSP